MSTGDSCPHRESVARLLAGQLPADSRQQLEGHADGCLTCRAELLSRLGRWTASQAPTDAGEGPPVPLRAPGGGEALGRYLLIAELGRGGMGQVFSAFDTRLDRKVALKFLGGERGPQPALAQLLGEAATMARLQHPNVVTVYDVGLIDGVPFISMELVDGVHLGLWRQQRPRGAREIAEVMAAAARGLAAAHAVGIVHRDVKPENILVAGGRVLVTDFGVAVRGAAGSAAFAGTPAYMAPEQLRGGAVDARADVFGLCATLFEMVKGAPPFAGLGVDERLSATPDRLPPAPRGRGLHRLHRLAARGLHPDPEQRPAGCQALAEELTAEASSRPAPLLVAAGVLVAAAGAFWGGRHLLGSPERQCRARQAGIDEVWNDGRRRQLSDRYRAAPPSASSFGALERMLDRYRVSWKAMYGDACAATFGGAAAAGPVFELRLQCLEARRSALDAFLTALAMATPPQLVRASRAVLPEVSDCGASSRLETQPLPADPQARAQLDEIDRIVGQARAQYQLGDYARSEASGARAVAAARGLGYAPTLATALIQQATALVDIGSGSGNQPVNGLDSADKLFAEAYAAAERGHDDRQRLAAAREQVILQARRQAYPEGERWAALAEGLLARLGNPAPEGSALYGSIGWLRQFEGKDAQAAVAFKRSLELARTITPPDPRKLATAESGVCRSTADAARRVACARKAIDTAAAAYGPQHPELGAYYALLGEALILEPDTHAEACSTFRKALQVTGTSIDPGHPNAISMLMNLAECLLEEGQVEEAKGHYEELIRRNPGPTDMGFSQLSYGGLLTLYGDYQAGVRHMQLGLSSFLKSFEPTNDNVLYCRNTMGEALVRGGQLAEAQRVLTDGLQAAARAKITSTQVAALHANLAAAWLAGGRAEAAARGFEESLRLHGQAGSERDDLAQAEHGLGASLLAQKRVAAALPHLERALQLRPARNSAAVALRADIPLTLARALRAQGGASARARACELLREAAASYRRLRTPGPGAAEAQKLLARDCSPRT